jgi:methionyl aminopeptidase
MGDIGYAVESVARKYGCSVVESFVGHGIGRHLHEEPMVMHTGIEGTGIPIVPGMVFTVEPILSLGRPEMRVLDDGWSVMAQDNSLCAQFEQTIAVMGKKTEILTRENSDPASQESLPPF